MQAFFQNFRHLFPIFCSKGCSTGQKIEMCIRDRLCDRVAIIRAGRLVRAGSMDEVRGDDSLEEVFLELEGTEAQA